MARKYGEGTFISISLSLVTIAYDHGREGVLSAETMSYVIMDVGILILCNHNTLDIHTLFLSQFVGSNSYIYSFAKLAAYVMLVARSSACLTGVHGRSFVGEPNVGQR